MSNSLSHKRRIAYKASLTLRSLFFLQGPEQDASDLRAEVAEFCREIPSFAYFKMIDDLKRKQEKEG